MTTQAEALTSPVHPPCPICGESPCAHSTEEKAAAAKAVLVGARPVRQPKNACRVCGCHGDCEGGCTWIEVEGGLLCSSHSPVGAF